MLLNYRLFIEKALGEKIIKTDPIHAIAEDRNIYLIKTANNQKYIIKIYISLEKYLREKMGLTQLEDVIAPRLVLSDDNKLMIITEYIEKVENIRSPISEEMLEKIILLFMNSLKIKIERKLNHEEILDKYSNVLLRSFPTLKLNSPIFNIISNLKLQPKCGCHGDFHPENVLVAKNGNLYLTDFESICMDTPLLDVIRFSFSPFIKLSYAKRVNIVRKFTKKLESKFGFKYSKPIVDSTCIYWAITCAGFYLSNHKKETEKESGKYNYILKHCLNTILKLTKNYG